MHFTTTTLSAILALTTSALAVSHQAVLNRCNETVYLTFVNSTQLTTGPIAIGPFGNWESQIVGVGNSLGVTKDDRYWLNTTPKLILGTSTDDNSHILYWSISNVDGDPFAGENFTLTSSGSAADVCQNATGYDGKVHACKDDGVVLTLSLC